LYNVLPPGKGSVEMSKKHKNRLQSLQAVQTGVGDAKVKVQELVLSQAKTAHQERRALIVELERLRGTKIITYVTAGRQLLGAQIGADVIRLFLEHLNDLAGAQRIDLFLITRGGITLVPTRLVGLIREYCGEFGVLVPYMAHSAGTLIALGADEIVMGPMGELGPVDPSVGNQFNPTVDPADASGGKLPTPRPRIPISVEDLSAYLSLAKERAALGGTNGMADALKALTDRVHPLALGNIHRQHMLIRRLVKQLLTMHMDPAKDKDKIDQLTETLTEKLYAHEYVITRKEARDQIGLKVNYSTPEICSLMWKVYEAYEGYLGLERDVDLPSILGSESKKYAIIESAVIESGDRLHVFSYKGWLSRKGTDFDLDAESSTWEMILPEESSSQ